MSSSADDAAVARLLDLLFSNMDGLGPALKSVIACAKGYQKALSAVTTEASKFFEQLLQIGQSASEYRTGTRHIGNALKEVSETYRQIELQRLEKIRSLLEDFILPLESRHASEAKALSLVQKGYREDRQLRLQIVEKAEQDLTRHRKKHRKQAQGDFDVREDQLQSQIQDRVYELAQVRNTCLRKVLLHERKVYCFLLEYLCAFIKADSSYHGQAHSSLQRRLNDWIGLCNDPHHLPDETEQLIRNPSMASRPRWLSEDRPTYMEDELPTTMPGLNGDSDNESWEQPAGHLSRDYPNQARSVSEHSPDSQTQSEPRRQLRHLDSFKRPLPDPPSAIPPSLPGEGQNQGQSQLPPRSDSMSGQPSEVALNHSGHWHGQQSIDQGFVPQQAAPVNPTSNPPQQPPLTRQPTQQEWAQLGQSHSTHQLQMQEMQQPQPWQQQQPAQGQAGWPNQGNWQWQQGQAPPSQQPPPAGPFPSSQSGSFGQMGYDKPSPAFVQQGARPGQGGYLLPQQQQQWPFVPHSRPHRHSPEPHYEEPDIHRGRRGRHRHDRDKSADRRHRSHSRNRYHDYSSESDSGSDRHHRHSSSPGRRHRGHRYDNSSDESPRRHRRNRSRERKRSRDESPRRKKSDARRHRSSSRGRSEKDERRRELERDLSPRRRGLEDRDLSPQRRDLSPQRRDLSPRRRDLSPRRRDLSPRRRDFPRDLSPRRRDPSPPKDRKRNGDDRPKTDTEQKPKGRKGARFKALYNLTATGATQLSFTEGDIIEGVGEPKEGWQYGENIRTAKTGWFPSNYVEKIQAARPSSANRTSAAGKDPSKPSIPQPDYANRSPASPPPTS